MSPIIIIVLVLFYFAPTLAAIINKKSKRDIAFLFLFNVLFGWSIIGWFIVGWKATRKTTS